MLQEGAVAVIARRWKPLVVRVVGHSMRPSFDDGDRLMALRRRRYHVGDVVVFRTPDELRDGDSGLESTVDCLVKRVAAVAGDPVPEDMRDRAGGDLVPPGYLLVRGDNPDSLDSRRIGLVSLVSVLARVVCNLDRGRVRRSAPTALEGTPWPRG
jgi:signal peptidase I